MEVAVKERPILMHARSIRGILEGRKTQTRRIIKGGFCFGSQPGVPLRVPGLTPIPCPYGQVGDRLWVRETWADTPQGYVYRAELTDEQMREDARINRMCRGLSGIACPWKASIHMPRRASRLTLEITDIRVERVQDISTDDCIAEGAQVPVSANGNPLLCVSNIVESHQLWRHPKDCKRTEHDWISGYFALLWEDTNGKGAWERNDWVWVITFRQMD